MEKLRIYVNPPRGEWPQLASRARKDDGEILDVVRGIVDEVKRGGDQALREICARVDKFVPKNFEVPSEEISAAHEKLAPGLIDAINEAANNIQQFHRLQIPQTTVSMERVEGVRCEQLTVPIEKVGLYIPGGQAPLFSTVLMLGSPAHLAGCREVILCTPPGPDGHVSPAILYAASCCGVHRVFAVGGAQAIAAMAYGTGSIPRVYKIFGPGNRYVTGAKQIVSADAVAIDMPAGPSEVMVVADDFASPLFVAADLLSQSEHGRDSQGIAVCSSIGFAEKVADETKRLAERLPRSGVIADSLQNSRIIVLENLDEALAFANFYAPEHLILSLRDAREISHGRLLVAGSVFIGNYSPESAGDYASGTNHTLPTSGWATAFSGINTESFMRKMTLQELTYEGLSRLAPTIITMAEAEGLDAHAYAVKCRLDKPGY